LLAACPHDGRDTLRGGGREGAGRSVETLRRWDRDGKIKTLRDDRSRRRIARAEVDRASTAPRRHETQSNLSARNRFPGIVTSVEVSGVMALVEIEAGPHRITAAITRDSVEELGLREGTPATATMKATSVMVQAGSQSGARRPVTAALDAQHAGGVRRARASAGARPASTRARGCGC
jgi:molybdopterin-binding protein